MSLMIDAYNYAQDIICFFFALPKIGCQRKLEALML
jgi:hypothetical protein